MRRSLYLTTLFAALVVLALGGWAVEAARYALTGSRRRALAPS